MADQQTLGLDVPRVAKRSTSRVVRRPFMTDHPGEFRREMLEAYRRHGPMTARDACDYYGTSGGWRRVSELLQGGHLEPTGEMGPGNRGRIARILKITDRGRAALEASS